MVRQKQHLSNEGDIIKNNIGLVMGIARSFVPHQSELDDYIQVGSIGLLKAIRKYNPSIGKLSTFAVPSIRWEIIRYIKLQKKHKHVVSLQTDIEDTRKDYRKELWELCEMGSDSNVLTDEEYTVFTMKSNGNTFVEIAKKINVSNAQVSTTYKNSINKIKKINI